MARDARARALRTSPAIVQPTLPKADPFSGQWVINGSIAVSFSQAGYQLPQERGAWRWVPTSGNGFRFRTQSSTGQDQDVQRHMDGPRSNVCDGE